MNSCFFSPRAELKPYIERYWSWDSAQEQNEIYLPVIPPATGIELFIHHGDPFVVDKKGSLTADHLVFSTKNPSILLPSRHIGFIAIRFRTGSFRYFTDVPLSELNGHFVDMRQIWGQRGTAIAEQVSNTQSMPAKIFILEKFLMDRLAVNREKNPAWDHIINELQQRGAEIQLTSLPEELHMSYRHFRRKFITLTGMAPKHFQQLARFHATLKPLLLSSNQNYLSSALANGYFDQTHFIKEFKQYMEITPSDFLQKKNFMSHFYYHRM